MSIFFFEFSHPYPLALAVNKSLRLVFYHACSTEFEKKLEGLWTGYLRVSIRSSLQCLAFVVFSYNYRRIISFAIQNVLSEPEFTYRNPLYPKAYYCIKLDHQCMPKCNSCFRPTAIGFERRLGAWPFFSLFLLLFFRSNSGKNFLGCSIVCGQTADYFSCILPWALKSEIWLLSKKWR